MSDDESKSNFDVICKKVFELDEKIRSARIINGKGKLVAGGIGRVSNLLKIPKKMRCCSWNSHLG